MLFLLCYALIQIEDTFNKVVENKYQHLHNKINNLSNEIQVTHKQTKQSSYHMNTQPRIINLTHKKLTKEQMNVLNLGPQYTMELKPNRHIKEIIIETENAIRQIEPKWQNTYRFLAAKRIKQIKENNK